MLTQGTHPEEEYLIERALKRNLSMEMFLGEGNLSIIKKSNPVLQNS